MSYVIAGKKIASEWLAIGTFTAFGVGVFAATRGGGKKEAPKVEQAKAVAVGSASGEEEAFIREFVARMEKEEAAAAKH